LRNGTVKPLGQAAHVIHRQGEGGVAGKGLGREKRAGLMLDDHWLH